MTEIWEMKSDWWRLPIMVEVPDMGDIFVVNLPPIPLLESQRSALIHVIDEVQFSVCDGGGWFVQKSKLQQVASKSDETDPENTVRWDPDSRKKSITPGNSDDQKEFMAELVDRGIYPNVETAEVIWSMICETMVHMILNCGKTIDFRFAKLMAFPLRANWKEVLWDIDEGRTITMSQQDQFTRVGRLLVDARLRAFNKDGRDYQWTLEITPSLTWMKMVKIRESRKIKAASKTRLSEYHERQAETIKFMLVKIFTAYRSWLSQINAPFFSLADRNSGRFAINSVRAGILPAPKIRWYPLPVPVSNSTLVKVPLAPLRIEIKFMPEMPEFLPTIRNVWEHNPFKGKLTWKQLAERMRVSDVAGRKNKK